MSSIIYTVTVIDDSDEELPPYQRVVGVFTKVELAHRAVANDEQDISESGNNRYAVIEKTSLDTILPEPQYRMWLEWQNGEYVGIGEPEKFSKVVSFGIN